jgi:hypothetical protein
MASKREITKAIEVLRDIRIDEALYQPITKESNEILKCLRVSSELLHKKLEEVK